MQENVKLDHEVILKLRQEAKEIRATTSRKPLWKYKMYVIGNNLIIDYLWPCIKIEYEPDPEIHGKSLHDMFRHVVELAEKHGLKVKLYSRYPRQIDCFFHYASRQRPCSTKVKPHRIYMEDTILPDDHPHDDKGESVIERNIPVFSLSVRYSKPLKKVEYPTKNKTDQSVKEPKPDSVLEVQGARE